MDINKQIGGVGSRQQQAERINNFDNTNITIARFDEGRCRTVCKECFDEVMERMSFAMDLAQKREMSFQNELLERIVKVEGSIEAFKDPAFLKSLKKAQMAAVCTDAKSDYELLAELMVKRFEVKNERQRALYVNKAIGVVDEISSEALVGLTMMHVMGDISLMSNDYYHVRRMLSYWYEMILGGATLPMGKGWVYDLELLGIARINDLARLTPAREAICRNYDGLTDAGIRKDSEAYNQAVEFLKGCGLGTYALTENPTMQDYVIVHINRMGNEYHLCVPQQENAGVTCRLNNVQLNALVEVLDLYDKSEKTKDLAKDAFVAFLREDAIIKDVMDWWDAIPIGFSLNPVAYMLANVNARRIDSNLPVTEINN